MSERDSFIIEHEVVRQGTGFAQDPETVLARLCHPGVPYVDSKDSETELRALHVLADARARLKEQMNEQM